MDLGLIAMKEYTTFLRAPELESHYQMISCHIQVWWGSYSSVEMQLVYSTVPVVLAVLLFVSNIDNF